MFRALLRAHPGLCSKENFHFVSKTIKYTILYRNRCCYNDCGLQKLNNVNIL